MRGGVALIVGLKVTAALIALTPIVLSAILTVVIGLLLLVAVAL